VGDQLSDAHHLLSLASVLAIELRLPEATRLLLQRHRNPMFQQGCGVPERDLGNIHANLSTILHDNREPLTFRHALTSRRRRSTGGSGPLTGVPLMILQWFAANNIRQDASGVAPPNPPETWTVFWAIRSEFAHLIAQPGHSMLNVTSSGGAGCGYAMDNLVKRGFLNKEKVYRVRPNPPPGNGVALNKPNEQARSIFVYWLAHDAILPA